MALLTETARPTAVASMTAESELGALSWFASMCGAFSLLGFALVRDRVAFWTRPARPPAPPTPSRLRSGRRDRPPYVTRCGRPPAR